MQDAMFKVVGYFSAGGGSAESEIWTDQRVLGQAVNRTGSVSSVQLRAASAEDRQRLIDRITKDEQIALKAVTEEEYFAEQAAQSEFLKRIGQIIAFFLTIGAMFAVANTMYGAIASRAREIGTLPALGFGRFSVLYVISHGVAGVVRARRRLGLPGGAGLGRNSHRARWAPRSPKSSSRSTSAPRCC